MSPPLVHDSIHEPGYEAVVEVKHHVKQWAYKEAHDHNNIYVDLI